MAKWISINPSTFDPAELDEAAELLRGGGIVAFPTETVYGLGANAKHPGAVERLTRLKNRSPEKPFPYQFASTEDVLRVVGDDVSRSARRLMDRYWPGPLTLILPIGDGTEMGGFRVPANPVATALLQRVGEPLFVPSANPADAAPATTAAEVEEYFGDRVDMIVDGGACQLGESSTVVRIDDHGHEVLREGIITREMVHQLIEGRSILFVCTGNTCRSPMAAALFRKHLAAKLDKPEEDLPELGYRIESAGTFASHGSAASDYSVVAVEELGGHLVGHRSQPITRELLADADKIYALSHSHLQVLLQVDPEIAARASLLGEEGVSDPVGGSLDVYRKCASEIEQNVIRLLEA